MISRRKLLIWVAAAVAATGLLLGVLIRQHRITRARWTVFLVGSPPVGAKIFEKKGCVYCHAVNGWGGHLAVDLGYQRTPQASLNQLVTAMWNHAPHMWDRMRQERIVYPDLYQEEVAHLFAFLYTSRYVDEPGDPLRGKQLFQVKNCSRCHALRGAGTRIGPDLSVIRGVDTPIVWTQAMWNHAPAMEAGMKQYGFSWPKFQGTEMNDLLAYIREVSSGPRRESTLLPADPEKGWELFQSKSCIHCHSVESDSGHIGPELGAHRQLPPTLVQFAGLMWNHSPEMWRTMRERGIQRPLFEGRQMADLIAFLYSLRYFEPVGSPQVGEHLFTARGCAHCHGARAEGTAYGPAVRTRGESFTCVSLATALWRHGPKMYQRMQKLGLRWPSLVETDVGDLVSFLNSPPEENR